jgi:tetratricopeptide (TPR) repeat protein
VRFATEQFWFRPGAQLKFLATAAVGSVVIFLLAQEWRQGRETLWLARAEHTGLFSPERIGMLERAFAAEPKNFQTAYDIGECYRTESWEGGKNYRDLARKAMDWYARAMPLDPHDGYNYMRTAMCLDWIGEHAASEKYYSEAELHDPNGLYFVANLGWHYVQVGDYAAARQCFIRSLDLGGANATARNYLYYICEPKLVEQSSGRPILPMLN